MSLQTFITEKIDGYQPKNGLDHIAKFFLAMSSIKHGQVTGHVEKVALLSEAVAQKLKLDAKAAFFAGLLHDVGKIILPSDLFDGHNISQEEYEKVKQHALLGSEALKSDYLFISLCAGLHHAMYQRGYGLSIKDFPESLGLSTVKKILQISAIISICDFIEAFTHRQTKIKDSLDGVNKDLKSKLYDKYPNDILVIDLALETYPELKFWEE